MKKLRKQVFSIILLGSIMLCSISACKKGTALSPVSMETTEASKVMKMKKFISVVFEVDLLKVLYDPDRTSFSFPGMNLSRTEIEGWYDHANEYKFKYEK